MGEIEGVRKGCVAVFGSADPRSGTERLIVAAETKETDEEARAQLRRRIEQLTLELLEASADEILLVPPRSLPKTSSGKIRRAAARSLKEAHQLGRAQPAVWRQWVRLETGAWIPGVRRLSRGLGQRLYGVYCWTILVTALLVVWPLVVFLPRLSWRWAVAHRAARAVLRVSGIRLRTNGLENMPAAGEAAVLVANHTSYLDGLALTAAFPQHLAFVAKQELEQQFIARSFLRGLGALFVERARTTDALAAGGEAVAAARKGRKLLFFPEATFTRAAGLLDFRLGAFSVATESRLPIVPVALRGTRSILRDGQWLPRRGRIDIEIAEPILPAGEGFAEAIRLRDAARAEILQPCGEPDLAQERAVFSDSGVETVRP